jgi:hypothetical protein
MTACLHVCVCKRAHMSGVCIGRTLGTLSSTRLPHPTSARSFFVATGTGPLEAISIYVLIIAGGLTSSDG